VVLLSGALDATSAAGNNTLERVVSAVDKDSAYA